MAATYEIQLRYVNQSIRISGVEKARFRDLHLWFWDGGGTPLLVLESHRVSIARRVDIDPASADEDVAELIPVATAPHGAATVTYRIPGVTSVDVKSEFNAPRYVVLGHEGDDRPAALLSVGLYSVRRQGAAVTLAP